MTQSPEPWKIIDNGFEYGGALVDANGVFIAGYSSNEGSFLVDDPNYLRIVACVNFCRHLPTEFLLKSPDGADAVSLVHAQQYVPRRKLEITGG